MLAALVNRDEFLKWIGRLSAPKAVRFDVRMAANIPRDGALLLWRTEPAGDDPYENAPLIIVNRLREFYAFASTYIGTYRPFSAFFRVITNDQLSEFESFLDEKEQSPIEPWLIGPILTEALAQSGRAVDGIGDVSAQACLATASSPIAQAVSAGLSLSQIERVFELWHDTRQKTGDEKLNVAPGDIWAFWRTALRCLGNRESAGLDRVEAAIRHLLLSVINGDDDSFEIPWGDLLVQMPRTRNAMLRMAGAREDRVKAMDDALVELKSVSSDPRLQGAIAGYLAARAAGGSLRYFQLLATFGGLGGAELWFGLFCGASRGTDVLSVGDSLGRHVQKLGGFARSLVSVPSGDIALAELEVVSSEFKVDPKIRLESQNVLRVEIYPGLLSYFRRPRNWRRSSSESTQQALSRDVVIEARNLAKRIDTILASATADRPQTDLFEAPRPSGMGRRVKRPK